MNKHTTMWEGDWNIALGDGASAAEQAIKADHDYIKGLEALLNTPHTGEFFESVRREAGRQISREVPCGRLPWPVGFLLDKVSKPEKHHIISSAAATTP